MEEYRDKNILDDNFKYTENVTSLEAQLNQSIEKNRMYIPAFKTSLAMAKRYNDPDIPFSPNLDMESIYAKSNPFTLTDALRKTTRLYKEQVFQSWTSLIDGAWGAVQTGDVSKLWDNETNTNVAAAMEAVEELYPHYQTQDQQDNPFAIRNLWNTTKMFLPSASSALAMVTDALLTEAVFIGAGAAAGQGGGAIPGAFAGLARIAAKAPKYFKDIKTLSNAIASGKNSVRAWKAGKALKNVLPSGKMVMSGFISAGGEAGLQAKMASSQLVQEEVNKYMEIHGTPPDKATLEKIKANAAALEQRVYMMNVPVLMASNLNQLGNIFKGTRLAKAGKNTLSRSKGQLGLTKRNQVGKYLWDLGKSMASEGLEEYYQGASTTAAQQHYSIFTKDSKDYTDRFFKEASTRWTTLEGQMEFAGGALIGGLFSGLGSIYGNVSEYNKNKQVANITNSTTKALYQQYGQNEAITDSVLKDVEENKISSATQRINSNIFNLAKMHLKNGTWGSMDVNLDDILRMDVNEFNEVFDTKFTQQEKNEIVGQVKKKFNMSLDAFAITEEHLAHNPLIQDPRFKSLKAKIFGSSEQKKLETLWEGLTDTFAQMVYNRDLFNLEEAQAALTLDKDLSISNDIQGLLNFEESSIDDWLKAKKLEAEALGKPLKVLEKIENAETYSEKLNIIINDFYKLDPKAQEKVNDLLIKRGMKKTFIDKIEEFNDPEKIYENAKEVADWMEYIHQNKLDEVGTEEEVVETSEPEEPKESYSGIIGRIVNLEEIELDSIETDHLTTHQQKSVKEAIVKRKEILAKKELKDKYEALDKTYENLDKLKNEPVFDGQKELIDKFQDEINKKVADDIISKINTASLDALDGLEDNLNVYGKENNRVKKAYQDRKDKLESGKTKTEQVQEIKKQVVKITYAEQQQAYNEGLTKSSDEALADLFAANEENCN